MESLYHINRWGSGYFDVNDAGEVIAKPVQDEGASVKLCDLIHEARKKGLAAPLLIRFQDILRHRVASINTAFRKSIEEYEYQGYYQGVFPIKVNQLREVVTEILDAGQPYDFGLEVGSKPELFAGLALQDKIGSLMICNGYKDLDFIKMALMGIKLGKRVIIVIEKLEELIQILDVSKDFGVEPMIGIRLRLHSEGAGKWADSAGEHAKFGLSTAEVCTAIKILEQRKLPHCLKLVHFHIGSQVPDISTIKKAVIEAARFYAKLKKLGFDIEYMDVGGGLGIHYGGSPSAFDSSTNYSLQEYTNDIIFHIADVCNAEQVPHPNVISESGRAIVAHHSVLIVEAFGSSVKNNPMTDLDFSGPQHPHVMELLEIRDNWEQLNKLEAFHDALERKNDAHHMFTLGMLELEDKAKIETLYWDIGKSVVEEFKGKSFIPDEIKHLEDTLSDQYLCNFSIFRSLLDHWAVGQLFPIMPIDGLDQAPSREATLVDITCDSDGFIEKFIGLHEDWDTLPVHPVQEGNTKTPYYLGFFLMGAYQDIMGDLHNLFGRVNEVHVFLDPDEPSGHYIEEEIEGESIMQTLASVQFDANELKRQIKSQVDRAIKTDMMKPSEAMKLFRDYEKGLKNYTYLNFQ
ncbi:MAG TPA: biosynthetic arginine decarboxylase [Verrucomicrobia bacterium]|nr:biosynthetic arginine decarboxylase [Verrucomicrobiota bacterium]